MAYLSWDMREIGLIPAQTERKHDMINVELTLSSVIAFHDYIPLSGGCVMRSLRGDGRGPDIEFHCFGIKLKPICELKTAKHEILKDNDMKVTVTAPSGKASTWANLEGSYICEIVSRCKMHDEMDALEVRHVGGPYA